MRGFGHVTTLAVAGDHNGVVVGLITHRPIRSFPDGGLLVMRQAQRQNREKSLAVFFKITPDLLL
jgi:hypothetical protein